MKKKKYSLFIGRWQCIPIHDGHITLIESVLKEGKNVLIAIRDTEKDEKNPFDFNQRHTSIRKTFAKWKDKVRVMRVPDIEEICYGRDVGWGIREIRLPKDLEDISGTKIRNSNKHE